MPRRDRCPLRPLRRATRALLAASTHEGEEEIALDGFLAARGQFDLLILAPRHPRRSAEVQEMLDRRAWPMPCAHAARRRCIRVDLADTLGEMAGWYAMAGACLIGAVLPRAAAILLGSPPVPVVRCCMAPMSRISPAPSRGWMPRVAPRLSRPEDLGAALRGLTAPRQTALAAVATRLLTPQDGGEPVVAGGVACTGWPGSLKGATAPQQGYEFKSPICISFVYPYFHVMKLLQNWGKDPDIDTGVTRAQDL